MKITLKKPEDEIFGKPPEWDGEVHATISVLNTWQECREKCRLHTIERIRPIIERKCFMEGTIYHRLFEAGSKAISAGHADCTMSEIINEAQKIDDEEEQSSRIEDVRETLAKAEPLLVEYFRRNAPTYQAHRGVRTEEPFALDMCGVRFSGKIDRIFTDTEGTRWTQEHKFYSQVPDALLDQLQLDAQIGAYLTGYESIAGVKPEACLYTVFRKPGERRKATESLADFRGRVAKAICADPLHYWQTLQIVWGNDDFKMHSDRLACKLVDFRNWRREEDSSELSDQSYKRKDMLLNSGACIGKYGQCPYLPLCANGDCSLFRRVPLDEPGAHL